MELASVCSTSVCWSLCWACFPHFFTWKLPICPVRFRYPANFSTQGIQTIKSCRELSLNSVTLHCDYSDILFSKKPSSGNSSDLIMSVLISTLTAWFAGILSTCWFYFIFLQTNKLWALVSLFYIFNSIICIQKVKRIVLKILGISPNTELLVKNCLVLIYLALRIKSQWWEGSTTVMGPGTAFENWSPNFKSSYQRTDLLH